MIFVEFGIWFLLSSISKFCSAPEFTFVSTLLLFFLIRILIINILSVFGFVYWLDSEILVISVEELKSYIQGRKIFFHNSRTEFASAYRLIRFQKPVNFVSFEYITNYKWLRNINKGLSISGSGKIRIVRICYKINFAVKQKKQKKLRNLGYK